MSEHQLSDLSSVLDSLGETGIYVIRQDTHELLYFNRHVSDVSPQVRLGMRCHDVWPGSCVDCPIDTMGDKDSSHALHYNDPFGDVVDIVADKTMWEGIPSYVITISPHKLNYEEERGLEQIEKMYAKCLVTVFDECIIVNLTKNYYVSWKKDTFPSVIPNRGQYHGELKTYADKAIHPDDIISFQKTYSRETLLRQFERGTKRVVRNMRRKMADGGYHRVEFMAAYMEQFKKECWCVLLSRDIHDEYMQDQQRNVEMNQLAAAAKSTYQSLVAINLTQNTYYTIDYDSTKQPFRRVNGRMDSLIQEVSEAADTCFKEEFLHKFSREALKSAYDNGVRNVIMELRQMCDDGQYHWKSVQVVQVESPHTQDVLGIAMIKYIDEERRQQEENLEKERKSKQLLEDALRKAESASLSKSDFLSRMSHDIRTPLNAILGMTELAQLNLGEVQKTKEYLHNIDISGAHLLGLINEVLDVSKIESGKVELEENEVILSNMIQDVLLIVRPGIEIKHQNLILHIPEDRNTMVMADERRLRQVLINILENASKYSEEKGIIEFSLHEIPYEQSGMAEYCFQISDEGLGMKQEFLSHIFEPFSRAEDSVASGIPGTGLGLTIVDNIIKMMGGNLEIQSEYGKGSTFTIRLFLLKKDSTCEKNEEVYLEQAVYNFSDMQVLVAEDNELNRMIAEEMLLILGAKVETVCDGKAAVDAFMNHQPDFYDMIFMDIRMPVMNGYDAIHAIRNSGKEGCGRVPVIAMTADAFSSDIKKARLAGMNGHLAKPISMEEIRKTLIICLQNKKDENQIEQDQKEQDQKEQNQKEQKQIDKRRKDSFYFNS